MCKLGQGMCLMAVAAVAFVGGRMLPAGAGAVAAQPEKKVEKHADPHQAAMEAMMAKMQPGEKHALLEPLVGTFEGTATMWLAPEAEPMSSKATVTREWVMDGRFVQERVDASSPEGVFKGFGLVGYNTFESKYESVWVDSMSTYIASATGGVDSGGKVFTFKGDVIDPMTGKRVKNRTIIDLTNADREVMTGYCTTPEGKEYKCFYGVFERTGK